MPAAADMEHAARDWLAGNAVFRGQWCGAGALRSDLPTLAFGTRRAADVYAAQPNDRDRASGVVLNPEVFEAHLAAERVYCRTSLSGCDPFLDLDLIGAEFGRDVVEEIVREVGDAVRNTNAFEEMSEETGRSLEEMVAAWPGDQDMLPPVEAYVALRLPGFVQAVREAGYDAVAFGGSGETHGEMEWHIFDPAIARDPETGLPLPTYCENPEEELAP